MVLASDFSIAMDTWVLTRDRPTSSDFSKPLEQAVLTPATKEERKREERTEGHSNEFFKHISR